jgi:hypothetical protein
MTTLMVAGLKAEISMCDFHMTTSIQSSQGTVGKLKQEPEYCMNKIMSEECSFLGCGTV